MKKVLIFGKDGQLGFDLTRVFGSGYHQIALNREMLDITDVKAVNAIIQKEKPEIIINATAYNKVESAETDREQAFNVNAKGVENLAQAAEKIGAVFVHLSSDYVFDGSKEFFTEEDQPNPLNAYGASKLAGEELVKSSGAKFYLIRTSSVFGVKQSKQKMNFIDQMVVKAKQGQVLKVVKDQIMCPTYSLDLAGKVKELLEKPALFGTYHITNQGSCSWYEFTVKILELMNLKTQILPITSQESGSKVNRPKISVLKDTKLTNTGIAVMPPWQDALRRYLTEKYSS
jgi:dTDP-4-dehydrorhamnose reductase